MPQATTSAFEIQQLWVKHVDPCNGNALLDGANILQQPYGSPEHNPPYYVIPPYQSSDCGHNFQIEATVKNITAQPLTVVYRIQVCPASQGGQPLGGPFPSPPCGQLVASGATVTIQPGQSGLLPIWQLQMWSENIRVHNQIVDANTGAVYNAVVDYWDNLDYRADDWFIDVNVGTQPPPPHTNYQVSIQVVDKSTGQSASVNQTLNASIDDTVVIQGTITPAPPDCTGCVDIQLPNGSIGAVGLGSIGPGNYLYGPVKIPAGSTSFWVRAMYTPTQSVSGLVQVNISTPPPPHGCTTNADCPPGYHCFVGTCVPNVFHCATDADCPSGFHCVNGQCVPISGGGGPPPSNTELYGGIAAIGLGAASVLLYSQRHKNGKKTRRKR